MSAGEDSKAANSGATPTDARVEPRSQPGAPDRPTPGAAIRDGGDGQGGLFAFLVIL